VLWWILLGLAAVWLFKSWRRRIDRADEPAAPPPTRPAPPTLPLDVQRGDPVRRPAVLQPRAP
jgi:hypothetical protein